MKDTNLIFIISQPRSGSTLLQALLSNNNDVATASEPWLLLPFLTYRNNQLNNAKFGSTGAKNGIEDFLNKHGGIKEFESDLRDFLLKQYEKVTSGEKYVLDKTPRYYEILNEIITIFPNAKIIVLQRNPLAVLASMINTWGKKLNSQELLRNLSRDILNAPLVINDFIKTHGKKSNVYVIQYESIVTNPSFEIERLYHWLHIDYNENVLDYSKNTKHLGKLGDQTGVLKWNMPSKNSVNSWTVFLKNKKWKNFFIGYINYLPNEITDPYPSLLKIKAKKTKQFEYFRSNNELPIIYEKLPRRRYLLQAFRKFIRKH